MKIIFLNALQGQIESIKEFVLDQQKDTDIFCFQESLDRLNTKIFCQDWLKDYQLFFDKKRSIQPTSLPMPLLLNQII